MNDRETRAEESERAMREAQERRDALRAPYESTAEKVRKRRSNLDWLKGVLDTELPSRAKLTACAMALVTPSSTMTCYIGGALLRARTSTCKDTVQAGRADLVAAGWLRLLRKGNNLEGNHSSVYRLVFPPR